MGVGLLVESPVPVAGNMKVVVEFPLQCQNIRADIDLKWSRSLGATGTYNWAAGGLWSQIDEQDRMVLLNQTVENVAFEKIREDQRDAIT